MRKFPTAAIASLLVSALAASVVHASASHEGWPDTVVYKSHANDESGEIQGTKRSDELLGGHGDDTIWGRGKGDVIWGDFKPCCQPTNQHDRLNGGGGRDFIYASHGWNDIAGGPGNDTIHAHFGAGGTIDCGPGRDLLFLSHRSKPHYKVRHCERKTFKHEGK